VINDTEGAEEWTNTDAAMLRTFIDDTHPGKKLMRELNRSVLEVCFSPGPQSERSEPIREGMVHMIGQIRRLSQELPRIEPEDEFNQVLNYQTIDDE